MSDCSKSLIPYRSCKHPAKTKNVYAGFFARIRSRRGLIDCPLWYNQYSNDFLAPLEKKVTDMIREIRMIAFLMAIIIICLALGALSAPQRDLSAKQEEHQKRFGAVYMTLNNPFYEIIDEEIRTEVEKHGDVLLSRDPALSVEKQTEEIEDLIHEGVSVIFLNPVDFERMGPALEAARAAHIPVITIDTNVQDSDFVASTIETDNYAAGRACAEHLLQHADHANILLLKHSSAHSAVDRITGFRQTIAGHPGFTIVDEAECDGQLERAMPAMQEMLSRHPEADTVMALNDPSALGAMAALESCGRLQSFRVYGVDGVPETKELILAGRMTATAAQSPRRIGRLAAQQAYRLLDGEPVDRLIQLPTHLWTQENLTPAKTKRSGIE